MWDHFKTILWLRWRLTFNRARRGHMLGAILTGIVLVLALVAACVAFIVAVTVGVGVLDKAEPDHLLLLWDGVVVAFLFFWIIGVITELQRSEALSFDKLLHLPVSLRGLFLLNYASSFLSLSLVVFAPAMIGLAVALLIVKGMGMLLLFPLIIAFLLMVTAVTYQFRGWLVVLMLNKRRRGTIIAAVTLGVVLLAQLPQLLNILFLRTSSSGSHEYAAAIHQMQVQAQAGELTTEQLNERLAELNAAQATRRTQQKESVVRSAVVVSLAVPPGWLAYGARSAGQHRMWPAVLSALGMMCIGVLSLGRSYRTTMRLYTGGAQDRRRTSRAPPETKATSDASVDDGRVRFLERRLPWCSEHASAIALGGLRSLLRTPQTKLMLLTPMIMLAIFGSMLLAGRKQELSAAAAPFLATGAIAMTVMALSQLIQNMFAFDRDGFRVLILSAAARHDVLLGKNLSITPFAVVIAGAALVVLKFVTPLQLSHFLASFLQLVCILLICFMVGNFISIVAPMAASFGSLKRAKPKLSAMLKQTVFALMFPIAMSLTLIPLGIELLLDMLGWRAGVPVYLILSAVELGVGLWIYRQVLRVQGRMLQRRELQILAVVTQQVD